MVNGGAFKFSWHSTWLLTSSTKLANNHSVDKVKRKWIDLPTLGKSIHSAKVARKKILLMSQKQSKLLWWRLDRLRVRSPSQTAHAHCYTWNLSHTAHASFTLHLRVIKSTIDREVLPKTALRIASLQRVCNTLERQQVAPAAWTIPVALKNRL